MQIQGAQYRHFMSASHSSDRLDSLQSLERWVDVLGRLGMDSYWNQSVGDERCSIAIGAGAKKHGVFGPNSFRYTHGAHGEMPLMAIIDLVRASLVDAKRRLTSVEVAGLSCEIANFLKG